jgi:predicted MFS family arabinose efflux permease
MLEWKPRLVSLVLVLIGVAALSGNLVLGGLTRIIQYGW